MCGHTWNLLGNFVDLKIVLAQCVTVSDTVRSDSLMCGNCVTVFPVDTPSLDNILKCQLVVQSIAIYVTIAPTLSDYHSKQLKQYVQLTEHKFKKQTRQKFREKYSLEQRCVMNCKREMEYKK